MAKLTKPQEAMANAKCILWKPEPTSTAGMRGDGWRWHMESKTLFDGWAESETHYATKEMAVANAERFARECGLEVEWESES